MQPEEQGAGRAGIAITLRELAATELRAAAGWTKDARAVRRMLAIALVLEGVDRTTAAQTCGMDRQTLRGEEGQETVRGGCFPGERARGSAGHPDPHLGPARHQTPRAPRDTRYHWAFAGSLGPVAGAGSLFGAVCPARGTAAGLVLPFANDPNTVTSIATRSWAQVN